MPFYMMMATGMVILVDKAGQRSVGGTCAAYRHRHVLLTAGHCVPETNAQVLVEMPGEASLRHVNRIVRHEESDVALLFTDPLSVPPLTEQTYTDVAEDLIMGDDFAAFGYPAEGSPDALPVGRLFKGNFMRYFGYAASSGSTYFAGEMSIAAPSGLSGAPTTRLFNNQLITGIVTTNVDSSVVLDSVDEVSEDDVRIRIETHRVISYG